MANVLRITRVNQNLKKNKLAHHTSNYMNQTVLRRGQDFTFTFNFNRALKPTDTIKFVDEIGKSPNATNKIKTTFTLSKTVSASKASWSAVADSTTSATVNVSITPPANAIIGYHKLTIQLFSEGYTSHVLGDVILLFNPWEYEDDVYLADESERVEYVLSDSTILYYGNVDYIGEQGWNLGQFEDGILPICLQILEKQTSVELSLLYDPKQVSRVCSAMINSNDENGVVTGNWSSNYSGGVSPTKWTGSVEILRKWAASGPVRYGQCWVFAGVLCTVMRCLGIPNRVVTNFSSAHDTDETLSIDSFYDFDGRSLGGKDSVWNFHVWNEAWFTRSDLTPFYDGWQVLDATPQETSGGIYRLGPTAVKAVKVGDIGLPYDGAFVYSEMNADEVSWLYDEEEDSYERIKTSTSSIGKFTSTKAVGTNDRVDVTSHYKFKEGTAEEREVYHTALQNLHGRRNIASDRDEFAPRSRSAIASDGDEPDAGSRAAPTTITRAARLKPITNKNIRGEFKDSGPTVIGQDVNVILVLYNSAVSRKITINFNVNSTGYTRRLMTSVLKETRTVTMGPNEEKETPFIIPYSKYIDVLRDDKVLEISALCRGEDNQKLIVSKVIILQSPSMTIKVLNKAILNEPLNVEITVMNPIDEPLNDCELHVEGSGLVKEALKRMVSMKPKEMTTVTVEFTPYKKGQKQVQVALTGPKILIIKGYSIINVGEA